MKTKMKQQFQIWLDQSVPLGISGQKEFTYICAASIANILYSSNYFAFLYNYNYELLYLNDPIMTDFVELIKFPLYGFYVLFFAMIILAVYHYRYHFQGSKSIYLMRRLPDQKDLKRRCLRLPFATILMNLFIGFMLICLYYMLYMLLTPEESLQPNQWQKLWNF